MKIKELIEALTDAQKEEAVKLEKLTDIINYGAKLPKEDVDEFLETVYDDITNDAQYIQMWCDINGGTNHDTEIIEMMKSDVYDYIAEMIADLQNQEA